MSGTPLNSSCNLIKLIAVSLIGGHLPISLLCFPMFVSRGSREHAMDEGLFDGLMD